MGKSEELLDILKEAEIRFRIPTGLLSELIREERLRLYQLKRKPLKEEVKSIFERHERKA